MATKPKSQNKPQPQANAAPEAQPMLPQLVYPALQQTLDRFIGPESDYTQSVKRLEKAKAELAQAERIAEFEARKLETLLRAVDAPEVSKVAETKWWDEPLRRYLINCFPDAKVNREWPEKGATLSDIERALDDLIDQAEHDPSNPYGSPFNEHFVLDVGLDRLFDRAGFEAWHSANRAWGLRPEPLTSQLAIACHRVLGLQTPEQVKAAKKAVSKAAAKAATVKPQPPAPKPSKSRGVSKTAEVAALAAKASKAKAAKASEKKAAEKRYTNVVLTGSQAEGWKVKYREIDGKGKGHTRSFGLIAGSRDEALDGAAKSLGLSPSDVRDETARATTAPAVPAASVGRSPVADGHVLATRDGRWHADVYESGVLDDTYDVCPAGDEVEHAIRVTCRVLSLDPKDLRVLDPESGQLLDGTAAELLQAEAQAEAAPQASAETQADADERAAIEAGKAAFG